MKLIVGLGNPGKKYERTRHNAGWRAVQAFKSARESEFGAWSEKFQGRLAEGRVGSEKVALLLPETFMNASGEAVSAASNFWHLAPTDILAVYDDVALPLGTLRLRHDGSAGGHNGMDSILARLGTQSIPRLRIGIGSPHTEQIPLDKFVLEPFAAEEEDMLQPTLDQAAEAMHLWLSAGLDAAMQKFN